MRLGLIWGTISKFGSYMECRLRKGYMIIIICLGIWIIKTFIIKVCGIMIDGVLLEMNLIGVGICNFNAIMDWIFPWWYVDILFCQDNNVQGTKIFGIGFGENYLSG